MRRLRWKMVIAAAVVSLLILAAVRSDLAAYLDPAEISRRLAAAGALAPVLLILLMAGSVVVTPIPSIPLDVAAGALFGPLLGPLYASLGALLGAMLSFGIARFLGREFIERLVGGHLNFCETCSNNLLGKLVFFSRLVPLISFDVVSYGAGLTKMSLASFSVATFLGMLPLTFVYTNFGAVVVANRNLAFLLGVTFVASFFLLPRLLERYAPGLIGRLVSRAHRQRA